MTDDKREKIVKLKQNVAQKRSAKGQGLAVDSEMGTGPLNAHGKPKLPPGQHEVKNWPVLDLGHHPKIALGDWRLEIAGECEQAQTLSWDDFLSLPQIEDVSDFHCVTTWSRFDNHWRGVQLSELLTHCQMCSTAKYVLFEAYDGYTTNLSIEEASKPDVLLVHTWENQPLPKEHGGPVRVITPQLYAWKGAKWIKKITLLQTDQLGFWEVRGYSNTARPWLDDRYSR